MSLLSRLKNAVRQRSIHVCYVDTGSCNGCDIEILACLSPRYDLEQYGIYVHNNPREADILLVVGGIAPQWQEKLLMIWNRIPEPKVAIAIGNCAISGCVFNRRDALIDPPASHIIPISAEVPGCPPRPDEIIKAVLSLAPVVFKDWEERHS
ncbi:MAG: NADH-quinone oxidoreductase subunit B family protein [Methanospirillaceae archaeon]|nr:NADH-quinone oxidoreductase subunit B family protein [Methanospirillaceae archaeon]